MRWRESRRSDNVEDQRGQGLPGGMGFPGGLGVRRAGIGGFGLLVIVVLALLFGVDPSQLLQQGGPLDPGVYAPESPSTAPSGADDELRDFVSAVLGETEDTWREQFQQLNQTYREPSFVLFNGAVQSACGFAQAAMGSFYCPGDQKVYLDLDFLKELGDRFQAPGDFAEAYVIAHEVGHHVQNPLGIMGPQQHSGSPVNALETKSCSRRPMAPAQGNGTGREKASEDRQDNRRRTLNSSGVLDASDGRRSQPDLSDHAAHTACPYSAVERSASGGMPSWSASPSRWSPSPRSASAVPAVGE